MAVTSNAQDTCSLILTNIKIDQKSFEDSKIEDSIYRRCTENENSEYSPLFTQKPIGWSNVSMTRSDSSKSNSSYKALEYSSVKMERFRVVYTEAVYDAKLNSFYFRGKVVGGDPESNENFKVYMGIPVDTISKLEIICQHCEGEKFNTINYPTFYLKEGSEANVDFIETQNQLFDFTVKPHPNAFLVFQKEGYYAEIYRMDRILEEK